jgi:hypothetical protein
MLHMLHLLKWIAHRAKRGVGAGLAEKKTVWKVLVDDENLDRLIFVTI